MMREMSEPDWRRIRKLEPVALDRFCRRILAEVGAIFYDLRRPNAVQRPAPMRARGLVTDAEFAGVECPKNA